MLMNSPTTSLNVEGVHVWRGDRHVLRGVSFSIGPGKLLHIAGSNGVGKTTLLRVVCGLIAPESGEVRWQGRDIRYERESYQANIAFAAHDAALKADLTALENLRFAVGLRRKVADPELLDVMQRTGAGDYADLPARVLSAGQRRRVAMARVLACRAPLWLLDEPFSNLDAVGVEVISRLIDEHIGDGGAAVVVAHHGLSPRPGANQLLLSA
jgi:heme exporter protein A